MNRSVEIFFSFYDEELETIFDHNKHFLLQIPELGGCKQILARILEKNSSFVEFVYFLNSAIILKDINKSDIKVIFDYFKKIINKTFFVIKKWNFHLKDRNESLNKFFQINDGEITINYAHYNYQPEWRNKTISIYQVNDILQYFNMQSDGINLMTFLSDENHNLSRDAVSKSQRILNWISNDLNICFNEFEMFNWYKQYPISKADFNTIFCYFKENNKINMLNFDALFSYWKHNCVPQNDAFNNLIYDIENVFPNDYEAIIDYINQHAHKYIFKQNNSYVLDEKGKFTSVLIKILDKECPNNFYNIKNIKENHPEINWTSLQISDRSYNNLAHKNILIVNTDKHFYLRDYDFFLNEIFPEILNVILNLSPGWYCSGFFVEMFFNKLSPYNLNDHEVLHKLLKYIFEIELNNKYSDQVEFERQPGIAINVTDIKQWVFSLFKTHESLDKVIDVLGNDFGWNYSAGGFKAKIFIYYNEFLALQDASNNLEPEKLDLLKTFLNERQIISHDELKAFYVENQIDLKYYNKYILCNELKMSWCNKYVCLSHTSLTNILVNELKNLTQFNSNDIYEKYKSTLDPQNIANFFANYSKKFNFIKYAEGQFINGNMFANELEQIKALINNYLNIYKDSKYVILNPLFDEIKLHNFGELNAFLSLYLIKDLIRQNYQKKFFYLNDYLFLNTEFNNINDFLSSHLTDDDSSLSFDKVKSILINDLRLNFNYELEIKALLSNLKAKWFKYIPSEDKLIRLR